VFPHEAYVTVRSGRPGTPFPVDASIVKKDVVRDASRTPDSGKSRQAVVDWASKKFKNPEHAKNFVEWFGDSKMVDENGHPRIVYHGTERKFTEFDPKKIGDRTGNEGHYGSGIYFSSERLEAGTYGENVIEAFLKVDNPFVPTNDSIDQLKAAGADWIDDKVEHSINYDSLHAAIKSIDPTAAELLQNLKQYGYGDGWDEFLKTNLAVHDGPVDFNDVGDFYRHVDSPVGDYNPPLPSWIKERIEGLGIGDKVQYGTAYQYRQSMHWITDLGKRSGEVTEIIKKMGHDGVVAGSEIVVFDPTNIKSPSNRGTWSGDDPRISMAIQPGTRKTEKGVDYVLKDSRWHRADKEDRPAPAESTPEKPVADKQSSGEYVKPGHEDIVDVLQAEGWPAGLRYNHRVSVPEFRGEITHKKVLKYLKESGSDSADTTFNKEIIKFEDVDDFEDNLYYHGSGGSIGSLKAGVALGDTASYGGGYGEKYWGISLSKDRNTASNFTGQAGHGRVAPVILKKGAKVEYLPGIEDASEIEDIIPMLWSKGIDAVKIGDWESEHSEQELVVLNPKAIVTGDSERFPVYKKKKMPSFDKDKINDLYDNAYDRYVVALDKSAERRSARIAQNSARRAREFEEKWGRPLYSEEEKKEQEDRKRQAALESGPRRAEKLAKLKEFIDKKPDIVSEYRELRGDDIAAQDAKVEAMKSQMAEVRRLEAEHKRLNKITAEKGGTENRERSNASFRAWNEKQSQLKRMSVDDGPRDGDVDEDGLVFRDHRWHRDDPGETKETNGKPADECYPQGKCYMNAIKFASENDEDTFGNSKGLRVVHGKVTNAEGKTFDHAWVESGEYAGTLYDPTQDVTMGANLWYTMTSALPEARYTVDQAQIMTIRTGTGGPWTDEERADMEGTKAGVPEKVATVNHTYSDFSPRLAKRLKHREHFLSNNKKREICYAFTEDGNQIFSKQGTRSNIKFDGDEAGKFENSIFTHSHPSGNSFSKADIIFAVLTNMKEIRAIGSTEDGSMVIHRLIRPEEGWGYGEIKIDDKERRAFYEWYDTRENIKFKNGITKLYKRMGIYSRDVVDDNSEKIESGEITNEGAEHKHWHEVMLRLSENWNDISPGDTDIPKYERIKVAA
jgi:hypothetical protein